MTFDLSTRLKFRRISLHEYMLLNIRNFDFFRKSDSGKAIMFSGNSKLVTWLIAIPYVMSSELVFFRTIRYYATLNNQIAGILIVREEPETIYVSDLAVAPEYRKRGIATAMIGYCITIAKRMRKNWLELSVLKVNTPARKLYEKTGFVQKEDRRWSLILRKKTT
jgi:ribosomal protein S18 acetylase RimI-like enzyme